MSTTRPVSSSNPQPKPTGEDAAWDGLGRVLNAIGEKNLERLGTSGVGPFFINRVLNPTLDLVERIGSKRSIR